MPSKSIDLYCYENINYDNLEFIIQLDKIKKKMKKYNNKIKVLQRKNIIIWILLKNILILIP